MSETCFIQRHLEQGLRNLRGIPLKDIDMTWHPLGEYAVVTPYSIREIDSRGCSTYNSPLDEDYSNETIKALTIAHNAHQANRDSHCPEYVMGDANYPDTIHMLTYECYVPDEQLSRLSADIKKGKVVAERLLDTSFAYQIIGDEENVFFKTTEDNIGRVRLHKTYSENTISDSIDISKFKPNPEIKFTYRLSNENRTTHNKKDQISKLYQLIVENVIFGNLKDSNGNNITTPDQLYELCKNMDNVKFDMPEYKRALTSMIDVDTIQRFLDEGILSSDQLLQYYEVVSNQMYLLAQKRLELVQQKARSTFNEINNVQIVQLHLSAEHDSSKLPLGYLLVLSDKFLQSIAERTERIHKGTTYGFDTLYFESQEFLVYFYSQIDKALKRGGKNKEVDVIDNTLIQDNIRTIRERSRMFTPQDRADIFKTLNYLQISTDDVLAMVKQVRSAKDEGNPLAYPANAVLDGVHQKLIALKRMLAMYRSHPQLLNKSNVYATRVDASVPTVQYLKDQIRAFGGKTTTSLPYMVRFHDDRLE